MLILGTFDAPPARPKPIFCPGGCGSYGVCDEVHGKCICQAGWTGQHCERETHPACSLGQQTEPLIQNPCSGLRKVSPVACECLLSCLQAGEEVCGHASVGCNDMWKRGVPHSHHTFAWNCTNRITFHEYLTCIAYPAHVTPVSSFPLSRGAVLTTLAAYERSHSVADAYATALTLAGGRTLPSSGPLPAYGAGLVRPDGTSFVPTDIRGGGVEPSFAANAKWMSERNHDRVPSITQCVTLAGTPGVRRGCSGRGRCLLQPHHAVDGAPLVARCVCVDGAFGPNCEHVSSNNCLHDCSGRGLCVHGFCRCDAGSFGVDCSDSFDARLTAVPRALLHVDSTAYGPGPVGMGSSARIELLPAPLRSHVKRLREGIFVYDLPPSINRDGDMFSTRYWGGGSFAEADPIHMRRIYASQALFDGHLLRDDYVRTLQPSNAKLFYVPTFLMSRHTWGSGMIGRSLLRAYHYIRHAYPYWNRSQGRDHVWFMPGEKMVCDVPREILSTSIVVGHWGGRKGFSRVVTDCVDEAKDIVVPPITPIQHDLSVYRKKLRPAMLQVEAKSTPPRQGPLLLFAGGIFNFGASQDYKRATGYDTEQKQERLYRKAQRDRCSKYTALPKYHPRSIPVQNCRNTYSMGVRGAIWRARLWAEPDMRIVSAGIPNYLKVATDSHFCLHTEGNSWGTRMIDALAVECIPLIVNDGMIFPYHNIISMQRDYPQFSIHLSKEDVPKIASVLRSVPNATATRMRRAIRLHKRGFIWFRPEGLAYEYTLAALGERLTSYLGSHGKE